MKYLVCSASSREVWDRDILLNNHKHNKELCELLQKGEESIIYQIAKKKKIISVITFTLFSKN